MSNFDDIQLIECPRDAIQGLKTLISTQSKVDYLNALIKSDLFECIDFGSFVSAKAVPQMQDTAIVLEGLEKINGTKLLAIIANEAGVSSATKYKNIDFLGYPFSISETFQKRNVNASIQESYHVVKRIQESLLNSKMELVVYISMAFGNPYGDEYHEDLVLEWIDKIEKLGVKRFSIADTTSEASSDQIKSLYSLVRSMFSEVDLSVHLHSSSDLASAKIQSAYDAGCRRFEGALLGYGGCPFAKNDLVGNIPTEILLQKFNKGTLVQRQELMHAFQKLIGNV